MDQVAHGLARARALSDALKSGPAADALLEATIAQGFSREVAASGIAAELESWSEIELSRLLSEVAHDSSRWPRAVLILAARTLPASAMRQVFLARALGARAHLKSASGQGALAEAMALADSEVRAVPFTSDDTDALDREVERVDTVVVLGSDESVAAVAQRVPEDKGFAGHGHKVSAALVLEAPTDLEVEGLAADLLAWDQAGCLAPQVVWSGVDRTIVARRLADAVMRLEAALPLATSKRAPHLMSRREITTLATMLGEVSIASESAVIATHADPTLRLTSGPRCIWVLPFDNDALNAAAPALSSLAVIGSGVEVGPAIRVCRAGELQRPPLDWRQDGLEPLRSLLRPSGR